MKEENMHVATEAATAQSVEQSTRECCQCSAASAVHLGAATILAAGVSQPHSSLTAAAAVLAAVHMQLAHAIPLTDR